MRWRCQCDWISVVQNHGNGHSLFEVFPIVVNLIRTQFVLFKALVIHEDESPRLVVEELCFEFFNIGNFKLITTLEGSVQNRVSDQIL